MSELRGARTVENIRVVPSDDHAGWASMCPPRGDGVAGTLADRALEEQLGEP